MHVLPKSSRLLAGYMPASGKPASLTASVKGVSSLLQLGGTVAARRYGFAHDFPSFRTVPLLVDSTLDSTSARCLEAQFVLESVVTSRQEMRGTAV